MWLKIKDELRQHAVRIAPTSGLTRKQVADDTLPVGHCAAMSREGRRWHVDAEQKDHVASRYGFSVAIRFRPRARE